MISRIKDRKDIAKDTLMIELDVSPSPSFKPGQYMTLALINPPYTDEKGIMRAFSIVNPPSQKNTLSFATRKTGSAFKRSLEELPLCTEVDVKFIGGRFIMPESADKKIVMIAGGIGITPFMSILRHATENQLPHQITLIYSNRNKTSAAFYSELKKLEKQNANLNIIFTMPEDPGWKGERRLVSEELIKEYLPDYTDCVFMVVGPGAMVSSIESMLKKMGVPKSQIIVESFTGY
jgi:ferredoxin-NADP reductase